jgi:O-antigen/teichoic acid export membrane protein
VLLVVLLAEPAIRLLYSDEYADAAPILRIQALALLPIFLAQAWTLGLVSLRRQRSIAVANAVALLVVLAVAGVLAPAFGTHGAALAGVLTEAVLALALLVALVRLERDVMPGFAFLWRPAAAAAAGAAPSMLLDVSGWIEAPIAAAVFVVVALAVKAVPGEILPALRGGR